MARIGAWTLSMLAVCAGAGASDLVTVPPGGIVAWSGQGIAECGAFGRRWAPVGNRCYFPVDLLEPEAEVPVSRWRQGRLEQAKIRVGPYPYPVQELTVVDSTVHLSEADAARAERERQLVAALWTRHGPVRFTLPLASPLDPLPEGRSFGRRRVLNGEPRSPHTGVDLSGPLGTPVRAVAAGVVALAGEHFFAGNSVFVDHGGGLITMYFHLDNLQVGEGDTLDRGQVIGALGATGRATGPHLHFGARWHGLRIDPMPLLGAGDIPEIGRRRCDAAQTACGPRLSRRVVVHFSGSAERPWYDGHLGRRNAATAVRERALTRASARPTREEPMERPRYYFVGSGDKVNLDFPHLGFDYMRCPYRFEAVFEHGVWRARGLVESKHMSLPEGSQCLHYGQQLFEGMKAQTGADGRIYAFRPHDNARRLNRGAEYLRAPVVPEELFVRGVEEVVAANHPYVPPFGSGAALYIRPFYVGVGDNVGVKPASTYVFRIFVTPVGPYFKGGFGPDQGKSFMVGSHDRAAPHSTGHIKAGGNYACSFFPGGEAKAAGYAEALYLDPAEHKYIEEIGAANFLGLKGTTLITPDSASVLPSITRDSLMHVAAELFGWPTETRRIALEELAELDAAACCGTAAVITWIQAVVDGDRRWEFPFDQRWQQLYDRLVGIQTATEDDPFGWRHEIPLA